LPTIFSGSVTIPQFWNLCLLWQNFSELAFFSRKAAPVPSAGLSRFLNGELWGRQSGQQWRLAGRDNRFRGSREDILKCYRQIMEEGKQEAKIPPKWDAKAVERIVDVLVAGTG